MGIKEIENSIKEKLKADLSGLSVESFPSNFADYLDKFSHPIGTVFLTYRGASYQKPAVLGLHVQEKQLDFSLILVVRAAKNEELYPYIDQLENILMGYKTIGCEKIYFTKNSFLDEYFGIFMYEIDFSTSTKAVEVVQENTDPLLTQVQIDNNFGETQIIPEVTA